ncbi:MAG TPA: hypothetical protein VKB40_01020 [Candidatus Acidoferrales bacterium]|nr:hypothetical protein [Candidatus Acidoferrales bacterium]
MGHKDARAILQRKNALRGGDIFFEGCFRFLHHADFEAFFYENVIDALPSGAIRPSSVNQNNIANAMLVFLCRLFFGRI